MVVVCERCKTRFKLGKKRIPPEGMRVRCSRCRHRFHFKPEPPAQSKHSVVQRVVEDTAPVSSEEEPDLENPEFLHERRAPSKGRSRPPPAPKPAPAPREEEPVLGLEGDAEPAPEEPVLGFEEPDSAPAAPPRAPAPPSTGDDPIEVKVALEVDDTGPAVGRGVDLGTDLEAFRMEGPIEETGPGQRVSELQIEDLGEALLASDTGPIADETAPGPEVEAAEPKTAKGWTPPQLGLRLPMGIGVGAALKMVTIAVALLLAGGALRAAAVFGSGVAPGPAAIRGAGWTATNLEAFHVRDLTGNRILVVRGRLEKWRTLPNAGGRNSRPRIAGTLLDRGGSPIGEEVRARPVRLNDSALAPEALSAVLDEAGGMGHPFGGGGGERVQAEGDPEGFTILFQNPPLEASRIRIHIRTPDGRV